MQRVALVDADTLVYECAFANEEAVQWDEDTWSRTANFDAARAQMERYVARIQEKLDAERVVMCLSDYTDPWRKRVMPDGYKVKRAAVQRPILFKPLREFIHETYETYQRPSLEADDVLGILLTNPVKIVGEKVVVSDDKDMKTLPGLHTALKPIIRTDETPVIREIEQDEADYWHMFQTLTGDRVDEYPGCPGVGPKKAQKILDPVCPFHVSVAWPLVVQAFERAGQSEKEALLNARVSRILRHGDYDYTRKEVKLWNPPTKSA